MRLQAVSVGKRDNHREYQIECFTKQKTLPGRIIALLHAFRVKRTAGRRAMKGEKSVRWLQNQLRYRP